MLRRLAAAAWLLALASGSARAEPRGVIEWLSPRAGEPWTAGSSVVLAWRPGPEFARLGAAEEWEAFLSLDGGVHYPIRLTPHLDVHLRRFTAILPATAGPAENARLLLRFGDEQDEVEVPIDGRVRILESGPAARTVPPPPEPATRRYSARGEAARPGEAGVVWWMEGGRRGDGAVVATFDSGAGLGLGKPQPHSIEPTGLPAAAEDHDPPQSAVGGSAAWRSLPVRRTASHDSGRTPLPASGRSLLSLQVRRNL